MQKGNDKEHGTRKIWYLQRKERGRSLLLAKRMWLQGRMHNDWKKGRGFNQSKPTETEKKTSEKQKRNARDEQNGIDKNNKNTQRIQAHATCV